MYPFLLINLICDLDFIQLMYHVHGSMFEAILCADDIKCRVGPIYLDKFTLACILNIGSEINMFILNI